MSRLIFVFALVFAGYAAALLPAKAQSSETPQQLQAMIANGQEQAAITQLQSVLQANPGSGVAWYLTAEAQDAAGNEAAARTALANAQHFAPGLPFANQADAAALQAHLNSSPVAVRRHSGISPGLVGIILLVILFIGFRMFMRRRFMAQPFNRNGYGPGPGPYPYNQGPGMGGPGMGQGMGIGGSLLGGLAAGAGFAAGERVIGDMFGGNNNPVDPAWGNQPAPNQDDGLQGSPGWDSGSSPQDDNFDPGNSW